jgi:prepilin-type processing-associated H-X9-DG protein
MASKNILIDLSVGGSVTSTSFVKSGGTSAQFLMADGSVSTGSGGTNTYVTSDLTEGGSGSETVNNMVKMTQAKYNLLGLTKDADTLYIIVG